jgi:Protein of unknown function (DUF3072)
MSGNLISAQPMDRHEARAMTDTVKRDLGHVYRNLVTLHERRGHEALGYGSWAEYCRAELDVGQSRAYQFLDAGRVIAEIEAHSTIVESSTGGKILPPLPANEAVAREIAKDPEPAGAWADVVEINGDRPTAKQTRAVVQERALKDPATDKQLGYLQSLAHRAGANVPDKPISQNRASKLIDHLRDGHACECRHCGRRMP